jgi:hypothetical protein
MAALTLALCHKIKTKQQQQQQQQQTTTTAYLVNLHPGNEGISHLKSFFADVERPVFSKLFLHR